MTYGYLHPLTLRVRPQAARPAINRVLTAAQPANWPPVNLREEPESYQLELMVPGFRAEDFTITLEQNVLRIQGKPQTAEGGEARNYHLREWQNVEFTYRKQVPRPVVEGGIQARYESGILHVALPKAPEAKPRTIQITTEKG